VLRLEEVFVKRLSFLDHVGTLQAYIVIFYGFTKHSSCGAEVATGDLVLDWDILYAGARGISDI
jgi:hypothetical protein